MNLLWHLFFYRPQGDLLGTFHGYFCLNLPSSRCLQLFSQLHNLLLQRLQIPNNLQKPVTWILQGQLRQAQPQGDCHGDCGGARGVGARWHDALIWYCDIIFKNCLCQIFIWSILFNKYSLVQRRFLRFSLDKKYENSWNSSWISFCNMWCNQTRVDRDKPRNLEFGLWFMH